MSGNPAFIYTGAFASERYVPLHVHGHAEIVLMEEGRTTTRIGQTILEATAPCLVIYPASPGHDQMNHGFVRTRYIVFAAAVDFDDSPRLIPLGENRLIPCWMEQAAEISRTASRDLAAEMCNGLLRCILGQIAEIETGSRNRSTLHPALAKALALIEAQPPANPPSVEQLAKAAGASVSHLNRLFRKHFGVGPKRKIQEARLDLAERLLHDPYTTVAQVARECGFDDPNYFSRLFRRYRSSTPGQHRALTS